jgi:hypothetical protein
MKTPANLHVLGSGNPFDADNELYRARLRAVFTKLPGLTSVCIHGQQQADLPASEAELGSQWLQQEFGSQWLQQEFGHKFPIPIWVEEKSKSTAETMASIVSHLSPLGRDGVIIVTNWPYAPRGRYLLRKAWEATYPKTPWREVAPRFRVMAVGGTFLPYWQQKGWRAVPWWLWSVATRELGASVKALLDPHDKKLNQNRGSAKRF